MKVFIINSFPVYSTGKIVQDLYKTLLENGHEAMVAYGRLKFNDINIKSYKIGSELGVRVHGILARLTDGEGRFSIISTKKLIKKIKEYDPDVIHLHNIHGYYLNYKILFDYLKTSGKRIVWTLHDCWAFTGHCAHFSSVGCGKWLNQCHNCPQVHTYPTSLFLDNSKSNYQRKKEAFTNIPNMTIVTVSNWLGDLAKRSFLGEYNIVTVHNGIDLDTFKPTQSDFRKRYGLENKKVILTVSTSWNDERKGLKDVLMLADLLDDNYKVIIVGLTEKEKQKISSKIFRITRTTNMKELVEIYSAADMFFNASVEETFGLPTVEAMACGTPVIVYNATAVPEVVAKECGFVVEKHDIDAVKMLIDKCSEFDRGAIVRATECFSKENMMNNYMALYKKINTGKVSK